MADLASLAAHPIRVFLMAWLICAAVARLPFPLVEPWRRGIALFAASAGALVVAALLMFSIWYVVQPTYFDWIEPAVTCLGWLWLRGAEMYPDVTGPVQYGHLYGPMTFLAQAGILRLFGPSIVASKAVGAVALALALACLYRACRRHAPPAVCLALLGLLAAVCLWFRATSFWNRPDSLLLLAVCLGVFVCESRSPSITVGGVAVALAAAIDLKLTSAACFIPILVVLWRRFGTLAAASCVAVAIPLAWLPFADPHISLRGFLALVDVNAHHGLSAQLVKDDFKFGAVLAAMLIPIARAGGPGAALDVASSVLAIVATAIVAAKPGSGVHHLLPIVPVVLWQASKLPAARRDGRVAGHGGIDVYAAAGITFVLAGVMATVPVVTTIRAREAAALFTEVRAFAASHDVTRAALAYGRTAEVSFAMPDWVFSGGPLRADVTAVFNAQAGGLQTPARVLEGLRRCEVDAWLVPRGEIPFTVPNPFLPGSTPAFDDAFRAAFQAAYVQDRPATATLDFWVCRATSSR
jgi:hypothetical protein